MKTNVKRNANYLGCREMKDLSISLIIHSSAIIIIILLTEGVERETRTQNKMVAKFLSAI